MVNLKIISDQYGGVRVGPHQFVYDNYEKGDLKEATGQIWMRRK